jgi:hypothetical protein
LSTCGCAPAQPTLDNEDFRYFRFAFSNIDDSWEPDKQRARRTFEACVALSRQYRLLTEYTLVCEHWLARTFKRDYARLDELVPAAHWAGPAVAAETRHAAPVPHPNRKAGTKPH